MRFEIQYIIFHMFEEKQYQWRNKQIVAEKKRWKKQNKTNEKETKNKNWSIARYTNVRCCIFFNYIRIRLTEMCIWYGLWLYCLLRIKSCISSDFKRKIMFRFFNILVKIEIHFTLTTNSVNQSKNHHFFIFLICPTHTINLFCYSLLFLFFFWMQCN